MLAALDSNVILYAEGFNDETRRRLTEAHIVMLGPKQISLSAQAIGEMVNAQIKQAKRSAEYAATRAKDWMIRHKIQDTTPKVLNEAFEIIERHNFQWWDAVILSAASNAGACVLLSEDMQSGFQWRKVTIVNPFLLNPTELQTLMALATRQ
jgi:predicted nucleic acid-binding protein